MALLISGILFGVVLTFVGAYLENAITHRVNYGKKVVSGRHHAGYIISCRYNGSKKYYFVDEMGDISKEFFYNKENAIEACRETHNKSRPKSTSFARVA
jgi:hypothetical protein